MIHSYEALESSSLYMLALFCHFIYVIILVQHKLIVNWIEDPAR